MPSGAHQPSGVRFHSILSDFAISSLLHRGREPMALSYNHPGFAITLINISRFLPRSHASLNTAQNNSSEVLQSLIGVVPELVIEPGSQIPLAVALISGSLLNIAGLNPRSNIALIGDHAFVNMTGVCGKKPWGKYLEKKFSCLANN